MYDLKCLIDDILNITENATDFLLNELASLLTSLHKQSIDTTCEMGIKVLGLCL